MAERGGFGRPDTLPSFSPTVRLQNRQNRINLFPPVLVGLESVLSSVTPVDITSNPLIARNNFLAPVPETTKFGT